MKMNRSLPFENGRSEVRRMPLADGKTEQITIRGYAAKYNVQSELMWDFREVIAPGAFDTVLQDDVRALFNHDPNLILGRTTSNTLRLSVDNVGLIYEVDLPDVGYARDLAASIDRGDVSQSSFQFVVPVGGDNYSQLPDGTYLRTITKFERLYDVSPVTFPAYPDADVGLRDHVAAMKKAASDEQQALDEQEAARQAASRTRHLAILKA